MLLCRKQKLHALCFEAKLFHNSGGVTVGQHWHNSEEITPILALKQQEGEIKKGHCCQQFQ